MKKSIFLLALGLMSTFGAQSLWADPSLYTSYNSSTKTLTYYFDEKYGAEDRPNSELYRPTAAVLRWASYHDQVKKVVIDASMKNWNPTILYRLFYGGGSNSLTGVTTIVNLDYLNTADVTDMAMMFYECKSLTSLDLTTFKTANVTDMDHMFCNCEKLTTLDLFSFNTSKVTSMTSMFYGCSSLKSINLSSFNTSKVTDMGYMFCNCSELTSVDMMKFRFDALTKTSQMFYGCSKLQTIYCGADLTSNTKLTYANSADMFTGCYALKGGKGTEYSFFNDKDKSGAHPDDRPNTYGYFSTKAVLYAELSVDGKVLYLYYDDNPKSAHLDWNADGMGSANMTTTALNKIEEVSINSSVKNARPTTCRQWFYLMRKLKKITNINYLNTSEVTTMQQMFSACNSLETLDVSGFDTKNVTSMYATFNGCYKLTTIDVSNFNTGKVKTMSKMFNDCFALTSINVSNFNTANVGSMFWMFGGCKALLNVDVSKFNTSNLTILESMFNGCTALLYVYLPSEMPYVTNTGYMFKDCSALKTIFCDVDLAANTNLKYSTDMFDGCTALKGDKGTAYSSSKPTGKSYAHPDHGTNRPGYFTPMNHVYTYRNGNVLYYRYDDRFSSSNSNMEEFDPIAYPSNTRWVNYHDQITMVVIEESMKNAKLTSLRNMFFGCGNNTLSNLTTIVGLERLNTDKVTDMSYMFSDCSKVTLLDISTFDISALTNTYAMFNKCSALETILCDKPWSESAILTSSSYMFDGCIALKGGNGTPYSASYRDKRYARPDGGPDSATPGYFSPTDDGIEEIFANPSSGRKVLYNGQVLIERGGKVYTVTGQKVL